MRSANQSSIPTDLTFVLSHSLIFNQLRLSVWLCPEYRIHTYTRTYVCMRASTHTYVRTRDPPYRIIIYYISYIVVSVACKSKPRTYANISRQRAHLRCDPLRWIRVISFLFVYRVVCNFIFYAEFAHGYSAYGRVLCVCVCVCVLFCAGKKRRVGRRS